MKKTLLIYAFIVGTLSNLYSQQITGKVLDKESGDPLIGVTIKIEGTQTGTITDLEGAFSISVKEGDVLLFGKNGKNDPLKTEESGQRKTV